MRDRNGKPSSKRRWGSITMFNGLLMAWVCLIIYLLVTFGVIEPIQDFRLPTTLILGVLGVGAGFFVATNWEPENQVIIHQNRDMEGEG